MKHFIVTILAAALVFVGARAQKPSEQTPPEAFPVRGFAIAVPTPAKLDTFTKFIETELAPARFNLLILRVDYNYAYETHPELRDEWTLSRADVKKIVDVCRRHGIRIAPQINLLGHQSWAGKVGKLLEVYPEFDETPHVAMPEKYVGVVGRRCVP